MRRCLIIACALAFLPSAVLADDVLLKGGGKVSGRILSRTETSVTVDVGPGTITVPMSSVLAIEERRSPLDDYHERAARLSPSDVSGWLQLGRWASSQGLGTQARTAFETALAAEPNNADANRALGRVQVDGRWMSEAESYRARGFVLFEGDWMPASDRDAIVARRDAAHEADWTRLESERRVREAEARAAEAEALARQAELSQYTVGAPFWYGGWGYGFGQSYGYGQSGRRGRKGPAPGEVWPPDINRSWPTGPLGSPSSNLGFGLYPSQPIGMWQPAPGSTGGPRSGGGRGQGGGARGGSGRPGGPPPSGQPPGPPSGSGAKPVRPR